MMNKESRTEIEKHGNTNTQNKEILNMKKDAQNKAPVKEVQPNITQNKAQWVKKQKQNEKNPNLTSDPQKVKDRQKSTHSVEFQKELDNQQLNFMGNLERDVGMPNLNQEDKIQTENENEIISTQNRFIVLEVEEEREPPETEDEIQIETEDECQLGIEEEPQSSTDYPTETRRCQFIMPAEVNQEPILKRDVAINRIIEKKALSAEKVSIMKKMNENLHLSDDNKTEEQHTPTIRELKSFSDNLQLPVLREENSKRKVSKKKNKQKQKYIPEQHMVTRTRGKTSKAKNSKGYQ